MLIDNNGKYLMRGISKFFTVHRLFGIYNVYHNVEGFVIQCGTQRQVRNAIRAYSVNKTKTKLGRE